MLLSENNILCIQVSLGTICIKLNCIHSFRKKCYLLTYSYIFKKQAFIRIHSFRAFLTLCQNRYFDTRFTILTRKRMNLTSDAIINAIALFNYYFWLKIDEIAERVTTASTSVSIEKRVPLRLEWIRKFVHQFTHTNT